MKMKYLSTTLITGLLLATSSSIAIAASDTKTIELEVIKGEFVQLTGSAIDGNSKTITMDSVKAGNPTDLGTLGVNSNIAAEDGKTANCTVSFSTLNNYSLNHEKSGSLLRKFYLTYKGSNISSNSDTDKDIVVSCSETASELKFTPNGNISDKIAAGAYKDTVTVVVTSP